MIDFKAIPPADGFDKLEALQVEVARLAALPELVYAQVRKDEAKRLGISPISVLDKAVKQARPKDDDTRAGSAVVLPEVEPWPDPVDGAELLDAIVAQLRRFVVADEHQLIAVALWIVHTHCFEAWWISPKLLIEFGDEALRQDAVCSRCSSASCGGSCWCPRRPARPCSA